jgi:hypothetical protein
LMSMPSPSEQAAEEACEASQELYDSCWNRIVPGMLFLSFAWKASWIVALVTLCMMCFCTENPHEVPPISVLRNLILERFCTSVSVMIT